VEDPPREPPPARFVEALSRGARGPVPPVARQPSRASDHTHGAPKLAMSDQPVLAETDVAVGSPTVRARLAAELDRIVAAFAAEARVG
jgi:hypothetical protein